MIAKNYTVVAQKFNSLLLTSDTGVPVGLDKNITNDRIAGAWLWSSKLKKYTINNSSDNSGIISSISSGIVKSVNATVQFFIGIFKRD